MNILLDTSVIVEIDRRNDDVIKLIKKLIEKDHKIFISTVTVSEILAGSYLKKDFEKAVLEAKRILGQFLWVDLDGKIAEKTGQYISYLLSEDRSIGYPDTAIAASCFIADCNYLLTLNKKDFIVFPELKTRVYEPKEFIKILR